MAFLDEIKDRLVAQSVGVFGTTIGLGSKAPVPPNLGQTGGPAFFLVVRETGGTGSSKTQNNTATQRPTAQLVARAPSYTAARTAIVAAYNALGGANGLYNVLLTNVMYLSVVARQEPTDIGLDERGMPMLAFNIEAEKAPS
jgi:hypothetical protein